MKLFISELKSCELIIILVINHFTNNIAPQVYILTAGAVSTNSSLCSAFINDLRSLSDFLVSC